MITELDKKLQDIAISDWKQFLEIAGDDFIITIKARVLRKEGKSYQQISMKLSITPAQARYACKKLG